MQKNFILFLALLTQALNAQNLTTPFEQSKGKETATYFEAIAFYKQLAKNNKNITIDRKSVV